MAYGHGRPVGGVFSFYAPTSDLSVLPFNSSQSAFSQCCNYDVAESIWTNSSKATPSVLSAPTYYSAGSSLVDDYDDASVWLGKPLGYVIPLFTVGGQIKSKRQHSWNDDLSVWSGKPLGSVTIPAFTIGGQIKSKYRYNWYDDTTVWLADSIPKNITLQSVVSYYSAGSSLIDDYDDAAIWQSNRIRSILTSTAISPFISNVWNFNIYGDSIWSGKPLGSVTIPAFTVGGQIKSKRQHNWYDDTAIWLADSIPKNIILQAAVSYYSAGSRLVDDYDDASYWSSSFYQNIAVFLTDEQSRSDIWVPGSDSADQPSWLPTKYRNTIITVPPFKPFVNVRMKYHDDPAVWSGSPIDAAPIPMLTVSGIIKARQWEWHNDDSAVWSGSPIDAAPIPMLTVSGIIKARQSRFENDYGETFWNIPPKSSASIPMLTVGGIIKAKQWEWHNDNPSMWSGWTNRNLVNYVIVLNPFLPFWWRFNNDDAAIWWQPPQRSRALPFVPSIVDHWLLDIPDDQPWSLTTQRDLVINSIQPKPIVSITWRFNNDDYPTWQQPVQRSIALPFVPVVGNHWQLIPVDDNIWSITIQHNSNLTIFPFANHWQPPIIDDPLWSITVQRNSNITITQSPFVSRYKLIFDDYPIWQPIKFRSIALPMVPAINNRYNLRIPDEQPWTVLLHRNIRAMIDVTAPPPPFTSRQPSFAFDDQSSYQWLVKSSLILSLKWNINFERITNTINEGRIVKAPPRRYVVNTIYETRITIAPDEDK